MKITFVGTSHGVPEKNRYCTCIMLESGGAIYFIDAGAPIVDFLVNNGKSVNDLRAVFTTHVHSDHTFPWEFYNLKKGYSSLPEDYQGFTLYGSEDVIEGFCEYMGNREDVWYATNIEIYDYVQAYQRLVWTADMRRVHNQSAIPVSFQYHTIEDGGEIKQCYTVGSGETLVLTQCIQA